jgi:hypothetical protein
MPIYCLKCKCGFHGDAFAKVVELDEQGRVLCPECGERAPQDWSNKTIAPGGSAVAFAGAKRQSMTEAFHSSEVAEARKLFGETCGACIRDDGTVSFKDRDEQRKYMKRKAEIYSKSHEL